jgi:carbamoyl-phosphate synthase large subunit
MTRRVNALVTAVGGIVGQGIMKCLKLANTKNDQFRYRILAADASPQAAGLYRSDGGFVTSPASAPEHVSSIIKICREQQVDAVFVGADEELMPLAQAKQRVEKESGSVVISNPPEVISLATDKWKTYEFLKRNNFPCAESALPEDMESFVKEFGFPIVVKPREGHGSEGFHLVQDADGIRYAFSEIKKKGWRPFLQEYLEAEESEFTSGVTVDREGKRAMSSISMRRSLKGGQTYKAFIDDYQDVRKSAEKVAIRLGAKGPVNVQARLAGGLPKVFEINPRFSASCPLRAVAGVNEPDLVFRNLLLGESMQVEHYERLVCLRFWDELYLSYPEYEDAKSKGTVSSSESFIPGYF